MTNNSATRLLRSPSIQTHLLLLVLAVSIPLVALVGYGINSDREQAVAHTKESLRILAEMMITNTSGKIAEAHQILERLAARPMVRKVDPKNCDSALKDALSVNPGYTNVSYANLKGEVICSAVPQLGGIPVNLWETEAFQKFLKAGRFSIGDPYLGRRSGKWIAILREPIWNDQHEMVGAMQMPLDLAAFDPHIPTTFLPAGSDYGFISEDGTLIWRNRDPNAAIGTRPSSEAAKQTLAVRDGAFEMLSGDGVRRHFSVVPMPKTRWIAFVGVPAAVVYGAANHRALVASSIAVATMMLLLLIAIAIARRIAGPVTELAKTARAAHDRELCVRAAMAGPREVAELAQEFNAMLDAQQRSEADLRIAATAFQSQEGMMVMDAHHVVLRVNSNFTETTGYSAEEIIGQPSALLKSSHHPADFHAAMWETVHRTGSWQGEVWSRRKNGTEYPIWLIITAVRGRDGAITHFVGTRTDFTQRKAAEAALAESRNLLQTIIDTAPVRVFWKDRNLRYLGCNPAFAKDAGKNSPDELIGQDDYQMGWAEQADLYRADDRSVIESGIAKLSYEEPQTTPDGRTIWLRTSKVPLRNHANEIIGLLGIYEDITERKRIANSLHTSTERLKEAQRIAHLGSWTLDLVSGELIWSDEVFRLFEIDPIQFGATYEAFLNAIHPEDRDAVNQAYTASLEKRTDYEITHRLLMSDGRIKWVQERCTSDFDEEGKPLRSRGTILEVTEQKRAEAAIKELNVGLERRVAERTAELERAKDAAVSASQAKSDFLASISHELRTPLNAILGFSELIGIDPDLPLEARDNAQEILQAGQHLLALINDMIDLSRIEANQLVLSFEIIPVESVLADSLAMVQPIADKHGIELINHVAAGERAAVRADPIRLRQVMINLLANAIKYNKARGQVTLSCAATADRVRISVLDTGQGIATDKQLRLFTAFDRLGKEAGTVEGSGIGLVISRRLVDAMGGAIGFESVEGQGSTFWLEFPLSAMEQLPAAEVTAPLSIPEVIRPEAVRHRVLYVDDNPASLRLMQKIFAQWPDMELRWAPTAELGIALAYTDQPAVILMDLNLPGMDGYEALAELKTDPRTAQIPVIALTANAMKNDPERARAAGFSAYISKPIDISGLRDMLVNVLGHPVI